MDTKFVHAIYFSPARSTRKIVRAIALGISERINDHDITLGINEDIELSEKDIVVIGVPSYSGRVPELAKKYLSEIRGNGASAIIVCVYGNRDYEDTLLELKEICTINKFRVTSAAAFIARHSMFPNIAAGRPNTTDLNQATDFGKKSLHSILQNQTISTGIKGNNPYRDVKAIPLKPKANSKCDSCGTCAKLCPVCAISKENPRKTDKKRCISCAGCIEICPQKARSFTGFVYKIARRQFSKKYNSRKENEFIF